MVGEAGFPLGSKLFCGDRVHVRSQVVVGRLGRPKEPRCFDGGAGST